MGKLVYGHADEVLQLDDRTLAHLAAVIVSKWRRGEKFLFTWSPTADSAAGTRALWMHPEVPLRLTFASSGHPQLNRRWLELLLASADSPSGLQLLPEP